MLQTMAKQRRRWVASCSACSASAAVGIFFMSSGAYSFYAASLYYSTSPNFEQKYRIPHRRRRPGRGVLLSDGWRSSWAFPKGPAERTWSSSFSMTTSTTKSSARLAEKKENDKDTDDTDDDGETSEFLLVQRYLFGNRNAQVEEVSAVLHRARKLLEERNISEPEWSAAHLLANAMELPWDGGDHVVFLNLLAQPPQPQANVAATTRYPGSAKNWRDTFASHIQRRLQHEPIQYIVGQWDFHGLTLKMRKPCLCPRPETEELVELALQDALGMVRATAAAARPPLWILDIGCGTGAIGIALAHALAQRGIPTHTVALDVEQTAVQLSRENALACGLPTDTATFTVHHTSIQEFRVAGEDPPFDLIVSNPPYIPPADMTSLSRDVLDWESPLALCGGGSQGLQVIDCILDALPRLAARPHGTCWMEVDPSQPPFIAARLAKDSSFQMETLVDFSQRDRFVKIQQSHQT